MPAIRKAIAIFVLLVAGLFAANQALAQLGPMKPGDYWGVSAIKVTDGSGMKYANFLAEEWRNNNEFAKSKGWIKDYFVLSNSFPREGEADLYLIRVFESMPNGSESDERAMEFLKWRQASMEQMQQMSGDRAEYREVISSSLLRHMEFRD